MEFTRLTTTAALLDRLPDALIRQEAPQNILLGNILRGREDMPQDWLAAWVEDGGQPLALAVCTPPFNMTIWEADPARDDALALLARSIHRENYPLPGVLAARATAGRFAAAWRGLTGCQSALKTTLNAMGLDGPPNVPALPGHCRELTGRDLYFAPYWMMAFNNDCGLGAGALDGFIERVQQNTGQRKHYFWEVDGVPVSQAIHVRSSMHGAVIGGVYTPPPFRGRGYATACVGWLSKELLARGYDFCALYADAANPVSNAVYHRLGYVTQDVLEEIVFAS